MRDVYGLDRQRRPEPLLPGEMADSRLRDDAEHWIAVYEELIGFLRGSEAADGQLARYHRRLTFWRHRRDQLGNGNGPDGPW